ncbi:MAG: flagellar motor switch protein FliM [Phycisphaerales bacterium]|jgi:flagellar motor switch protein FliM|nr:flagellar motor switch protein FliM [Phycisphaerales bacterium]
MDEIVPNKQEASAGTATPEVRPYDFRRPYKARVQRPSALEPLHVTFATRFAAALSKHLRVDVSVTLAQVEQLRYDEFLYSIGPATCLSVLRVDPPGAQAILDLSLPVVHPMILRLLGGSPSAQPHHGSLTEIEKSLALQIVERAAGELADTWSGGSSVPTTVREESLESDPASVRIMPGEEMVTALRFEVRIASGDAGGIMSLCLSAPILAELDPSAPPPAAMAGETEAQRQDLHKNILESAVELRALLAETHVRLSDVLDMQPGDVITTDKPAGDEVQVQVEGKDKLQAQVGQLHGNRVVQITRLPPIDEADDATPTAASADDKSASRSGEPS